MTAGELLRATRRRHGLTQQQLAIRARTSQAAVSRIERDVVSPSTATLAELLRLMNEELVLDAREVDWDHDVTLIRRNLELTHDERVRRGVTWSRRVAANVGAARDERGRENLERLAVAPRELRATLRGPVPDPD